MNYKVINSVVEDDAIIGDNSIIWHYSHVDSGARIGANCKIGQGCYIGKNVKIGNRCRIQNNVNIFTGVEIGNDVFIAPNVTFTNVRKPDPLKVVDPQKYDKTIIEDEVVIGASATILPGIRIGKRAFIAAGSVVTRNVPPNVVVKGNPAKIYKDN